MSRDIEKRLERLEDRINIENRPNINNYTPEEVEFLKEVADRVTKRIRKDHIKPEDEEGLEKIVAEVVAEVEGNKNTQKGDES